MPARKLEAYEFEQAPESNQTPLYQDYTHEAPVGSGLKDFIFCKYCLFLYFYGAF